MSIDMSQFYQVFFEESAESLASMENMLLEIDIKAPDPDQLNAIFRSIHSIKGSSATFGISDMTEVAHCMETLLDSLRRNEVAITAEMVDAFLSGCDVIKSMLKAHQNGTVADPATVNEICSMLARLTSAPCSPLKQTPPGATEEPRQDVKQKAETVAQAPSDSAQEATAPQHIYQIKFANSTQIFHGKEELGNLLEVLGSIGKVEKQKITAESVRLTLTTCESEDELRETFAFFLDPDQLAITLIGEKKAKSAASDDEQGYGFFVEVGKKPHAPVATVVHPEEMVPHVSDKGSATITAAETSIRVGVEKVDQMINLVGELVITKSILAEIIANMDQVLNEPLVRVMAQLEFNTRELQEAVMSVRMMPVNFVFSRFPRMVHDLAIKLGKKAQFRMVGEGTELDKGLIEKISDPLNHLVRNSMDHGIEMPEERIASGKDPQGTITMSAAHQGGSIVIQVSDDGAGLKRTRILDKARENGMHFNENISDTEVWQMIFAPGLSTATVVTDVSGRGVGMDVVKREIESIGGRVEISSSAGLGSTFTIRLPLTLAILDGLSIAVGDQFYIVPLNFIIESLQPKAADIKEISGQGRVLQVRGEYLQLIALHEIFGIKPRITRPEEGIMVLLEADGKKVALFVDNLVSQHQVVIKSLETNYRKVPGISGATIMGDGRVAMILDVGALVKLAQGDR